MELYCTPKVNTLQSNTVGNSSRVLTHVQPLLLSNTTANYNSEHTGACCLFAIPHTTRLFTSKTLFSITPYPQSSLSVWIVALRRLFHCYGGTIVFNVAFSLLRCRGILICHNTLLQCRWTWCWCSFTALQMQTHCCKTSEQCGHKFCC
jgi:hypothetical protein